MGNFFIYKFILSEENLPKINTTKLTENTNTPFNYRLRKLDTENYGSPDFSKKINILNFNSKIVPPKKIILSEKFKNFKIFQNINIFNNVMMTPKSERYLNLEEQNRTKSSYENNIKKEEIGNHSPINEKQNFINLHRIDSSINKKILNNSPSIKINRSLNISFSNEDKIQKIIDRKKKEKEERKLERKKLDKIIKEREEIENQKSLEEDKINKERIENEKEKRKKLRLKLDLIIKKREEKKAKKLKIEMEKLKRSKSEERKAKEIQRLKNEEIHRIEKEKQNKKINEKINNRIEQIMKNAKRDEELELNEEKLNNDESKHNYRIQVLKDLVSEFLKIYKLDDINLIFEIINKKGNINQSNNIYKILYIINKIGKLFKKEIDYDLKFSKDNIKDTTSSIQNDDIVYQFLGILGEELNIKYNIHSIIDKRSDDINLIDGIFKVLLSPYSTLNKYIININDESLKSKFLEQPKELFDFEEIFKSKICNKFKINIEKLYIISYKKDLSEFTLVILNGEKFDLKKFEKKLNVKIEVEPLLENIKLYPDFFENKFNRDINSWDQNNLIRGGEKYNPPIGWKGLGLKVLNKFDNGNNSWLGNEGKEGEWPVAYHGIGKGNEFKKLLNIILNNLKSGPCQLHKSAPNIRDKDESLSGVGVYLTGEIDEARKYASKIKLGNSPKNFRFVIMCRVKADQIRVPLGYRSHIIIDDNYDCLRPYRILFKETE